MLRPRLGLGLGLLGLGLGLDFKWGCCDLPIGLDRVIIVSIIRVMTTFGCELGVAVKVGCDGEGKEVRVLCGFKVENMTYFG